MKKTKKESPSVKQSPATSAKKRGAPSSGVARKPNKKVKCCDECGAPANKDTINYEGPLGSPPASILGTCCECGAPRYLPLGFCPQCKGPVYDFKDHFGCYNTLSGTCDFKISIEKFSSRRFYPCFGYMECLLEGNGWCETGTVVCGKWEFRYIHLFRSDDHTWDLQVFDEPIHNQ